MLSLFPPSIIYMDDDALVTAHVPVFGPLGANGCFENGFMRNRSSNRYVL